MPFQATQIHLHYLQEEPDSVGIHAICLQSSAYMTAVFKSPRSSTVHVQYSVCHKYKASELGKEEEKALSTLE